MADQQVRRTLMNLYRIVEAGEKGFATTASNMPNPGLKILLMSYAQQRANFKEEIRSELRRQGGEFTPGRSLPGMVHRGRVNIFAAMSIDKESQERVILKEAAVGEGAAMRTYASALSTDLPPQVREMVERQFAEVRKVVETIKLLRGVGNRKMVVNVYQDDNDASIAMQNLLGAGFQADSIERMSLKRTELYEGRGATVPETILSGAVGGAIWGGVMGVFAGIGVVETNFLYPEFAPAWVIWLL
ncbi:MAG: PA2169 family four-helix-bundle protein, partial [Chloroflexi bacterium]